MPNGQLVFGNTGSVTIMDENFKIVKQNKINGSVAGLVLR